MASLNFSLDVFAHSDDDLDVASVAIGRRKWSLHVGNIDGRPTAKTRGAGSGVVVEIGGGERTRHC